MEAAEGQGLVIKMAQKNKETQTVKLGAGGGLANNWFGYGAGGAAFGAHHPIAHHPAAIPNPPVSCQFYMDREEQLYRRACQLKGICLNKIQADDGSTGSDEEPSKTVYRYTLDEMKSYNPYRFINF
ncbi:uncharacterized protein [Drosophila kikkawai]|uniref:Uncharacterized protein n=1 Tax=Drosophila kikkawai TaxID=30033 RepID=A0A6P4IWL6_DROKI|nr:uncharacterized protein LOC108078413 [Drosophila kikkawai]